MAHPPPRTVEEVFNDFKGRRAGIVRALTLDVEEFYQQCDPAKENLCLYGHPNETWELNLPVELVPPELPEPSIGINFARDGMLKKDWLALVAAHSDSWLLSVAFYFGARFGFGKSERMMLFEMINNYPTIYEGAEPRPVNQPSRQPEPVPNVVEMPFPNNENESEDEEGTTFCGACGSNHDSNEFWICCDICEGWFHGRCVKITPSQAEHIKQYKCPKCSNKKLQPQRA